ncbi:MAG: Ig-like domain repeat protein [Methanosphaera sp.]|nr:Ig-like domain repeat protein [Methanosphaera sp.]
MLNNKKTFLFFTVLITVLFAMTIVSATDDNDTISNTNLPTTDESPSANDNVDMISEKEKIYENDNGGTVYKKASDDVKINTKITATPLNNKVSNTSINVTLKTEDNKTIPKAVISVLDRNNTLIANATTNVNGMSNIKLNLSGGMQSLTVKYDGNATYNPSNTIVFINVEKIRPAITLTATTPVDINQTITITATVKDANNKPVMGNVTVRVNNDIIETLTLSNGQINTTTRINRSSSHQIIATYNGNVNYTTVTTNQTVTVNKLNTTLYISVNNTSPRVNDKVAITVSLKDSSDKAVANEDVTVKINGKSYAMTTDKNGKVISNYTLTKSDNAVNVTATFKSTGNYLASKNSLDVARKYQADMQLLTGSFDAKPGDTVKLIAHIQDNHVDIDGGQLVFKLNGVSLRDENGSAVIVRIRNGLAILEYKIPDTLSARTCELTAVYSSNDYKRVESSTPMTIRKYVTHIDVNPLYTTNNRIIVKAQIVDQNNQALNKQTTVSIKLNGKSYTLNTTNGTINHQINQTLDNGYYNLTIICGENGKYLGSTVKSVVVKSSGEIKSNYVNNTLNTRTTANSGEIKTGTIMSILTGSSTVKPGDRLKLIAHLFENQVDINGGQLVFKINGLSLKDEDNNPVIVKIRDGLGTLDYKIPDTLGARTHNLTAVYSSGKYNRVELSAKLTMNRLNTHIEIDPLYTSSSTNYIKAEILDDNNQLINKETLIVIKIDGKSYNVTTSNGRINFKVPSKLSKGLHQITIIAGENGKYIESRKNTVLIQA